MDEITETLHAYFVYLLEFLSAFKALLYVKLYYLVTITTTTTTATKMGHMQARQVLSPLLNFLCARTYYMSVIEPNILKAYLPWRFVSKYLCYI